MPSARPHICRFLPLHMDNDHFPLLLEQSRCGDRAALGQLLEHYRPYLLLLAQRRFDPRLQSRVDPSDLVQLTFMEAYRDLSAFRGATVGEFAAWLRVILQRNVLQALERHLDAQRRSLNREQKASASGHVRLMRELISDQSTPSRRAMRGETAVELASLLLLLPDDQAAAIRLRHLEGWSLQAMAAYLDRSESAVAGLIKRGLKKLRQEMNSED